MIRCGPTLSPRPAATALPNRRIGAPARVLGAHPSPACTGAYVRQTPGPLGFTQVHLSLSVCVCLPLFLPVYVSVTVAVAVSACVRVSVSLSLRLCASMTETSSVCLNSCARLCVPLCLCRMCSRYSEHRQRVDHLEQIRRVRQV